MKSIEAKISITISMLFIGIFIFYLNPILDITFSFNPYNSVYLVFSIKNIFFLLAFFLSIFLTIRLVAKKH